MKHILLYIFLVVGFQSKAQVPASGSLNISTIADYMVGQYEITSGERSASMTFSFLNGRSNMSYKTKPYKISDWYGYAHISGPTVVCPTTGGITYSIKAVTGETSYTWAVPTGWSITSGAGTTAIIVIAGSVGGNVTVKVGNSSNLSAVNSKAVSTVCPTVTACNITTIYGTVTAAGYTWLDKNLGAASVATSLNDFNAYGSHFQASRYSDGHECINWLTSTTCNYLGVNTTTLCSGTDPTKPCGNSNFVYSAAQYWQTNTVNWWSPTPKGAADPCPPGFRIPSKSEFITLMSTFGATNNATDAFNSPLKFTIAGNRISFNGVLQDAGTTRGTYWINDSWQYFQVTNHYDVNFGNTIGSAPPAYGMSIRCINQ